MKLQLFNVKDERIITYKDNGSTFNELNHSKVIKEFKDVTGTVGVKKVGKIYFVTFDIKAKLIVYSSLTYEPFEYTHELSEDLQFCNDEKYCDEDTILLDNDAVNLDEIIYSLIITSLPIKLAKKGEKAPSGENFRVLTEEEYLKEKESEGNPFDKLKDLDL
ncbi:MAG: DUF177 domain-containing protein [Bacilli bacterium]|nr:DUF177 domain-containing protein [Bacilli bacterium]